MKNRKKNMQLRKRKRKRLERRKALKGNGRFIKKGNE